MVFFRCLFGFLFVCSFFSVVTSQFSCKLPFHFVIHSTTKLRKLVFADFICNNDFKIMQ